MFGSPGTERCGLRGTHVTFTTGLALSQCLLPLCSYVLNELQEEY